MSAPNDRWMNTFDRERLIRMKSWQPIGPSMVEFQTARREELRRYAAGDRTVAPPATPLFPTRRR